MFGALFDLTLGGRQGAGAANNAIIASMAANRTMRFIMSATSSTSCGSRLHHWLPTPPSVPTFYGRGSRPLTAYASRHPSKQQVLGASSIRPILVLIRRGSR